MLSNANSRWGEQGPRGAPCSGWVRRAAQLLVEDGTPKKEEPTILTGHVELLVTSQGRNRCQVLLSVRIKCLFAFSLTCGLRTKQLKSPPFLTKHLKLLSKIP